MQLMANVSDGRCLDQNATAEVTVNPVAQTQQRWAPAAPIAPAAVLCFSPGNGGMELDALRLARHMNRHLGPTRLVVRRGTWLHRQAKAAGLEVDAIGFRGSVSFGAIRQLRRLWRAHDIVNLIFLGSSELKAIHFSLTPQVKRLVVRHGTTKSSPKKDWVRRLTWSRVTGHWCLSEHLKRNVTALFPIGKARVFIIPASLPHVDDMPRLASSNGPPATLSLAHTGRLAQGKGQHDAIEVLAHLRQAGVPATLTLYGDGPQRHFLAGLARELEVDDVLTFAGFVDAPWQHYPEHDGFLFPSRGEGFGNAFVEALATGLPGFSYDNTVFPELKALGLHFGMAPDGDPQALAGVVQQALSMGLAPCESNIQRCRELFSVEREMASLRPHLA